MALCAPNILKTYTNTGAAKVTVEKSPLPYNDRRRFGARLKRLYTYLGTIKPSQYKHLSLVSKIKNVKEPCGSVCCAFGHAVVSGLFKDINVKFGLKSWATPDRKGFYDEHDITFKVINKTLAKNTVKAFGGVREEYCGWDDMSVAADAYFGPGAWDSIFDNEAYSDNMFAPVSLSMVRKRVALLAKNAYNVDVTKG